MASPPLSRRQNDPFTPRMKTSHGEASTAKLKGLITKGQDPNLSVEEAKKVFSEVADLSFGTTEEQDRMVCASPFLKRVVEVLVAGPEALWIDASTLISNYASDEENRVKIAKTPHAFRGLVNVLSKGKPEEQAEASLALTNLAFDTDAQLRIAETPGALKALSELLSSDAESTQRQAAICLANLALHPDARTKVITTPGLVRRCVELLLKPGDGAESAARVLANVTFQQHDEVLAKTHPLLIEGLVRTLRQSTVEGRHQAVLVLGNLTMNEVSRGLVGNTKNCIETLGILMKDVPPVRNQACVVLSNLSIDSDMQDRILALSSLKAGLVPMLHGHHGEELVACQTIANLVAGNPAAQEKLSSPEILGGLTAMLGSENPDAVRRAAAAVHALVDDAPETEGRVKAAAALVDALQRAQGQEDELAKSEVIKALVSLGLN